MTNNIEFVDGPFGTSAIIKERWQDAFLEVLIERGVQEVELNDGKGWRGQNLNFLKHLDNLKSLTIIDLTLHSIDCIHVLKNLVQLTLITYSKMPIDFQAFPNLEDCSFEWIERSDSLFEVLPLKKLFINRCNSIHICKIFNLLNLEQLSILNSRIDNIQMISSLECLKALRLANLKKLTSLQGLQDMHELEELEIQSCKGISTISEVLQLNRLKRLLLINMGDIESIKGIDNLTELKEFLFYESTNILDGDLSQIFKLSSLQKISYQNRKHYSHRREDFGKLYA